MINNSTKIALSTLLLTVGCATTNFRKVQRASDFDASRVHRVMVICVFMDQTIRQAVENEFAKEWSRHGVACVPSFQVLPSSAPLTRESIEKPLRRGQFDSALVLRVLERQTVEPGETPYSTSVSSPVAQMRDENQSWADVAFGPPVATSPYEFITLETRLYDVATEKRLWLGVTETRVFDDALDRIPRFVQSVLERLYSHRRELTHSDTRGKLMVSLL